MDPKPLRVVFVTGSLVYNAMVVERALRCGEAVIADVVVGDFIYPKKSVLRGAWMVLRKAGWRYFLFKVFETLAFELMALASGSGGRLHTFGQLSRRFGVPVRLTKDLNAPEEIQRIKDARPDLIVSMIPQKIGPELMAVPRYGVINLHPGLLPEYRAFGGYFWPLLEDAPSFGYTIHYINDVIDGGDILLREELPVPPDATVQRLYYESLKRGADGLVGVLRRFRTEGKLAGRPQDLEGRPCRPWPDGAAVARLKSKGYALFRLRDLVEIWRRDARAAA